MAKKFTALFMALVMAMSLLPTSALATESGESTNPAVPEIPAEIGTKTAQEIDANANRYKVSIDVPGGDEIKTHDEVILMVDGSYSLDNEWPAMKDAINTIGRTVLNGSGSTQLTLMAFGMGDNEVLVHAKDADELAAALGDLPGNLLYGRSSTNCEAGFTGVAEYIANHDSTLKDAHVIFISDGRLNTDETPRIFDTNWQTYSTKFGALTVAQAAFEGTLTYGTSLPAAFATVFGDRFDEATAEEIMSRAFGGEVTTEEFLAFGDQLWADVYAYSGLTPDAEYPISDVERAFVKYDKENKTYIQDIFYHATYKSSYVTYPNQWSRTPAAADALATMEEVKSMYVVDYDDYTAWMDTGITNEKATFVQSNGIAGLCEALDSALVELQKTTFNDVSITDYMSKWVTLDPSTLEIVDNASGNVIWNATNGWLITENIPTNQNPPVTVTKVDPTDYEAGGVDVVGNTSGDIYQLTWYVKDGPLFRSDSYTLRYEVTVDTEETGFVYGKDYPANGNTDLHYTDKDENRHDNSIDVPDVDAVGYTVTVNYVDEKGNTIAPSYTSEPAKAGTSYDVSAYDQISIDGYVYKTTDGALAGPLDSNKTITVVYTKLYTVIYTDGVNGETVFKDQTYSGLFFGDNTPPFIAFENPFGDQFDDLFDFIWGGIFGDSLNTPIRPGYTFEGWTPTVQDTVTGDAVYTATWEKISKPNKPVTPTPPSGDGDIDIPDEEVPLAPIPDVFSDDHFAYIIGYPKDYETGEYTEDQTRMPVMPQGKITRAEVATIFFRLLSDDVRELVWCETNDFSDVKQGQWFNNAISTMANMGIVTGYPDGSFRPNANITRAEFAAIAARFDEVESEYEANFTDIIGHWAEDEICHAAGNGWVEGYPDDTFRPNQLISRAEAMTLVNRVLHRLPETPEDLLDDMLVWVDNMDEDAWYYLAVQEATNSHDYQRKEIPEYETWTEMRDARDWSELEYR